MSHKDAFEPQPRDSQAPGSAWRQARTLSLALCASLPKHTVGKYAMLFRARNWNSNWNAWDGPNTLRRKPSNPVIEVDDTCSSPQRPWKTRKAFGHSAISLIAIIH